MPFKKNDPNINRSGRPKNGLALSDILRRELDKEDEDGKSGWEKVVEKLLELALNGDIRAIKEIMNRTDGPTRRPINVSCDEVSIPIHAFVSFEKTISV
jgi:hypothetical protein